MVNVVEESIHFTQATWNHRWHRVGLKPLLVPVQAECTKRARSCTVGQEGPAEGLLLVEIGIPLPCFMHRVGDSRNKPPGIRGSLHTAAQVKASLHPITSSGASPRVSAYEGSPPGTGQPRMQRSLLLTLGFPSLWGPQLWDWHHLDTEKSPGLVSPAIPNCANPFTHPQP